MKAPSLGYDSAIHHTGPYLPTIYLGASAVSLCVTYGRVYLVSIISKIKHLQSRCIVLSGF